MSSNELKDSSSVIEMEAKPASPATAENDETAEPEASGKSEDNTKPISNKFLKQPDDHITDIYF